MDVHEAPQWLLAAFVRSAVGAGATAERDEIRAVGEKLIEKWSSPGRRYHNLRHLVDVLARVDELAEETHEPDLVRLAAWYHGAIFDAAEIAAYANRGGEDEVASAQLARTDLVELGVPEARAERVHALVNALVRHTPNPTDFDCAVLCDADLAMLAADPQRYKVYLHDIRAEYEHLPVERRCRLRLLELEALGCRQDRDTPGHERVRQCCRSPGSRISASTSSSASGTNPVRFSTPSSVTATVSSTRT